MKKRKKEQSASFHGDVLHLGGAIPEITAEQKTLVNRLLKSRGAEELAEMLGVSDA